VEKHTHKTLTEKKKTGNTLDDADKLKAGGGDKGKEKKKTPSHYQGGGIAGSKNVNQRCSNSIK